MCSAFKITHLSTRSHRVSRVSVLIFKLLQKCSEIAWRTEEETEATHSTLQTKINLTEQAPNESSHHWPDEA